MRYLKFRLTAILFLFFICHSSCAQKQKDIWSGVYVTKFEKNGFERIDTIAIRKTHDIDVDEAPARFHSDPARWIIISKTDNRTDTIKARRFLYNPKDDRNEYEEFGWTDLYLKNKIHCLDAGHFFICQTTPGTNVHFKNDGALFTRTGLFGLMLHYGIFELSLFNWQE